MSLYVIDDHPLMREAVVMLLRRLFTGEKIIELTQLGGLDDAIRVHGEPRLFCLDLKLPDTIGLSGIQDIRARYPSTPLAVISGSAAADIEELCLEAGADVYIEKSAGSNEISAALRALLLPAGETSGQPDPASNGKLSKRQSQLLVMLDQGLSNREIADQLGISEHTVKVHLWRLFRRLGVKSRTQTLHYARANGLLGR